MLCGIHPAHVSKVNLLVHVSKGTPPLAHVIEGQLSSPVPTPLPVWLCVGLFATSAIGKLLGEPQLPLPGLGKAARPIS